MLVWQITIVAINLVLALAALIGFRYGMSAVIGVHAKDELDKKDNFAFGIAIAGGALALLTIMSGAISGEAHASLIEETLNIVVYSVLGIILLKVGFLVQDKLLLRGMSTAQEIKNGNIAAGIVVAVNLLAIGIVIRTSFSWVEEDGISGLLPVVLVYVASQIVLAIVTLIRTLVFAKRNKGKTWQGSIQDNNIAVAIRFAGQLLATAIALSSIGNIIGFTAELFLEVFIAWLVIGVAIMLGVWVIYRISFPIVLTKVDIAEEVDRQQNVGVAAIEASIFIGIASLFVGFLA